MALLRFIASCFFATSGERGAAIDEQTHLLTKRPVKKAIISAPVGIPPMQSTPTQIPRTYALVHATPGLDQDSEGEESEDDSSSTICLPGSLSLNSAGTFDSIESRLDLIAQGPPIYIGDDQGTSKILEEAIRAAAEQERGRQRIVKRVRASSTEGFRPFSSYVV